MVDLEKTFINPSSGLCVPDLSVKLVEKYSKVMNAPTLTKKKVMNLVEMLEQELVFYLGAYLLQYIQEKLESAPEKETASTRKNSIVRKQSSPSVEKPRFTRFNSSTTLKTIFMAVSKSPSLEFADELEVKKRSDTHATLTILERLMTDDKQLLPFCVLLETFFEDKRSKFEDDSPEVENLVESLVAIFENYNLTVTYVSTLLSRQVPRG